MANKNKRKALSKKIRFEVLKRDKFTCVYCGRKAPDVVLEVDHIKPVSQGGDDDITNLTTSCFDCNRGKKNVPLEINETVEKQRLQMELLQERREQLEMLLEWKEALNKTDEYESSLLISYMENKIQPYVLNKQCKIDMAKFFKKYKHSDILEAIDIASDKYLKFDNNDNLVEESIDEYLDKIGGILVNKNLPPIKSKLAYIKGIGKNRFKYWDNVKASTILNYYVKALKDYGFSDEKILQDLEDEVIRMTKEAEGWSYWCDTLNAWTDEINSWEK